MLSFDPKTHTYTLDGKVLPGVTTIIGQYKRISFEGERYLVDTFNGVIFPASRFDNPADIGTAIHKGCALIVEGKNLNWEKLPEELVKPLENYKQWVEDFKPEPILVEAPMASVKWKFAGTVDLVCQMFGARWIIDIKTGQWKESGPQITAYEKMYREVSGFTGKIKKAVLVVPKDGGKVKLKEIGGPNDWEFFKARLTQYNYLQGR